MDESGLCFRIHCMFLIHKMAVTHTNICSLWLCVTMKVNVHQEVGEETRVFVGMLLLFNWTQLQFCPPTCSAMYQRQRSDQRCDKSSKSSTEHQTSAQNVRLGELTRRKCRVSYSHMQTNPKLQWANVWKSFDEHGSPCINSLYRACVHTD